MIFHDFPWGIGIADWDVRMSQEQFDLRIHACSNLNTNPNWTSSASPWPTKRMADPRQFDAACSRLASHVASVVKDNMKQLMTENLAAKNEAESLAVERRRQALLRRKER